MADKLQRTVAPLIRMGEMSVCSGDEKLYTLLGSCIGLVLYDRQQRIGGLAHILLPNSLGKTDQPGKFADTAIFALVEEMGALADGKLKLIAKLAGGASMFKTSVPSRIGQNNIVSCVDLLRESRIPIVAQHCGGEKGRRMSLDASTGKVVIEIVGQDPIEL